MSTLDTLPLEILLNIFEYCTPQDLESLDQVCKRFHQNIRSDIAWKHHYKNFFVTNQVSEQFRKRCNLLLPSYFKYFISLFWKYGLYQQHIIREQNNSLTLWLQLTNNKLWWSGENMLLSFNRQEKSYEETNFSFDQTPLSEILFERYNDKIEKFIFWKDYIDYIGHRHVFSFDQIPILLGKYKENIEKFIFWEDYIITGHSTYCSIKWQVESPISENNLSQCIIKKEMIVHNKPIVTLDATSNLICSASDCEYVILKVPNSLDLDLISEDNIVRRYSHPNFNVQLLACHPLGTMLTVALSGSHRAEYKLLHMDLEQ